MVRATSIVLGVGLMLLWLIGLGQRATPWLTWLVGVGGMGAFAVAAVVSPRRNSLAALVASPMAVGIGLVVLWIIGVSVGATGWVAWWAFAFACTFFLLALVATSSDGRSLPRRPRTV